MACYFRLHPSHGGIGSGSAHKPFFASRASLSDPSNTLSAGAYFRYHQHRPLSRNLNRPATARKHPEALVMLYSQRKYSLKIVAALDGSGDLDRLAHSRDEMSH